jgi:putative (di)nucleoside polyphosphate hydrolase
MMHEFDTRYFRAGVGTVIYNQAGEVAFFVRAAEPIGIWQFQQGGIDIGEPIEQTLWRELKEEVGLSQENIDLVTLMPEWTIYEDVIASTDSAIPRYGQAHRWFFLKLKNESSIDLSQATEEEFHDYRWTTFAEAVAVTINPQKKPIYQQLETFYNEIIKNP